MLKVNKKQTKILIIILLSVLSYSLAAQGLSLRRCIDSAIVHYPISRQAALHRQVAEAGIERIRSTNMPQLDLSARATWQNEVFSLPVSLPGVDIPELSQDQYKLQVDIKQALYKGGLSKAQKALAGIDESIANTRDEADLNVLKRQVISLYYELILTRKLREVSRTYKKTMESRLQEMTVAVEEGVMLSSGSDVLKVEILTVEQRIKQLDIIEVSLLEQLNHYTGLKIGAAAVLSMPDTLVDYREEQRRPEYELMSLNRQRLRVMKDMNKAQGRPKAYAFSTLGYGRPGFNYLSDDFEPFAMVGLGLSWKLWDWGNLKKERRIIDINEQLIANRQEAFLSDLNARLTRQRAEIATQEMMLKKAREIVLLRQSIAASSAVEMKNGAMSSSRYVDEEQKYRKAQLDVEIYRIKLSIARVNYLWMLGRI